MNCRAVAAAWISLFSAVDLPAWNRLSVTAEDVIPLQKSGWWQHWAIGRWKKHLGYRGDYHAFCEYVFDKQNIKTPLLNTLKDLGVSWEDWEPCSCKAVTQTISNLHLGCDSVFMVLGACILAPRCIKYQETKIKKWQFFGFRTSFLRKHHKLWNAYCRMQLQQKTWIHSNWSIMLPFWMALQRFSASSSSYSGDSQSSSSSDPGSSVDEPPFKKVKPLVTDIRNLSWNQLQSLELDLEGNLAHFAMFISGIFQA